MILSMFIIGFFVGYLLNYLIDNIPENKIHSNKLRVYFINFVTGILFCFLYKKYGLSIMFFKYILFACLLEIIAAIDYYTTDIYFLTILLGSILGGIFVFISMGSGADVKEYIIGAVVNGVIMLLIYIFSKIGFGDVELLIVCGLFFGKLSIIVLVLSFFIAGISGISLIISRKKELNEYIPLAPSIAIASSIIMLFSENINFICI